MKQPSKASELFDSAVETSIISSPISIKIESQAAILIDEERGLIDLLTPIWQVQACVNPEKRYNRQCGPGSVATWCAFGCAFLRRFDPAPTALSLSHHPTPQRRSLPSQSPSERKKEVNHALPYPPVLKWSNAAFG